MSQAHKEAGGDRHYGNCGTENQRNSEYCHHLSIEVTILKAEVFLPSPLCSVIENLSFLKSQPR
jgi:hypothetical protein